MISETLHTFLSIDAPAVLTALLASLSCALLGNFLVLRKMSLMGDAISHSVLPGIVVAFLLTNTRSGLVVFIGAALAGLLTVFLIEGIKRLGRIESDTAMGVVFSILFAFGILLMEQASASSVDLDADCLLHGQLELIFWFPPNMWGEFLTLDTLASIPSQVIVAALVLLVVCCFVWLLFKELVVSSFDPGLSDSLGFSSNKLNILLMTMVAAAVVASFEAVGSILVIAMIICPAATARLLTDDIKTQISISLVFAALATTSGYAAASLVPHWFGWDSAVSAAGMITVASGLLFLLATMLAPKYGVLFKELRRYRLAVDVVREDILGLLFRLEEQSIKHITRHEILSTIPNKFITSAAIKVAKCNNEISIDNDKLVLTEVGAQTARNLVRKHRLWETFLVQKLGLPPDHVHQTATNLEHFTSEKMTEKLAKGENYPSVDPHDKPIPE